VAGHAFGSALEKNVDLPVSVRAVEVGHVLDDAEDLDVDLVKHLDGLAGVLQGDVGGGGDDDVGAR
jgi:hypothetical protein